MRKLLNYLSIFLASIWIINSCTVESPRSRTNFGKNWRFHLSDVPKGEDPALNDSSWRTLNLPHEWSIEGEFSADNPATPGGGALPGGIGWYRKSFLLPEKDRKNKFFIDFDGVYMDSRVWINGHFLGRRPNGYISFRYDLTPYLHFGDTANLIAVRVDNSLQPNSRWYSGSGIYRNVWLVKTQPIYADHWGISIKTPKVSEQMATVEAAMTVRNESEKEELISVVNYIIDPEGHKIASAVTDTLIGASGTIQVNQLMEVSHPMLWSVDSPVLYKLLTKVKGLKLLEDEMSTNFGIRYFEFDKDKGFLLNGKQIKIKGVCNHHDLGCLGSAVNKRAIERQLEILQGMGCNAIRTSHNPPAPELLDLCDRMGFIVMDEPFDMWKKSKTPYDFGRFWDEWHETDLRDFILRDRNHPSIFIWSLGNEILEQWDTSGIRMIQEIYKNAKSIDDTRPFTTANNPPSPTNNLNIPMVVDLIGYNYALQDFERFPEIFPGEKFIATETTSALATRGHYDMPSDSIRRWPVRWDLPFTSGNPDNTVSAYDNVSTPWGSTHEETWKIIKKFDYLSGMFVWTGFDYLGEPTPYDWPSRSSYFGIIDLAGFPKDSYYMYKSEWTDDPVLHIFPNWNWNEGDTVDVWAYFNCDEVELFLNDESQGVKHKTGDDLHVMWRLAYIPGMLKAIGRTDGKEVLLQVIHTAGKPAKIQLSADRPTIKADGNDLSFVTVDILDSVGNPVPYADNLVNFGLTGDAFIEGVDNGSQTSHEPFKANYRKAFNGKCLVVIRSGNKPGNVELTATSDGLEPASLKIRSK